MSEGNDERSASKSPPRKDRRLFLKSALAGGAASLLPHPGAAQQPPSDAAKAPPPRDPALGASAEHIAPSEEPHFTVVRPGSDFMVDAIKALGLEYIAANPGSSFRSLHESLVNYGGNSKPELLTCMHEESSVAIATGYARVTGRPMAAMLHATVGLQHGAMSIYSAFAERTPVVLLIGASRDAAMRRPFIEWLHSAQDDAASVRDYTKWDDQPVSLQHFSESLARAYKLATTVPMGPTLLALDTELQEHPVDASSPPSIVRLPEMAPPIGDLGAVAELAQWLASAEAPLIVADRYARTSAAMAQLVALAELVAAPVVDLGNRFNFPTNHPLNHTQRMRAAVARADVIVALEPADLWGVLNRFRDQIEKGAAPATRKGVKVATLSAADLFQKANYQDAQRYAGVDLYLNGDAEATIPHLIEAVRSKIPATAKAALAQRRSALDKVWHEMRERDRQDAAYGWNASPLSTARVCAEIWNVIKDEDWVLASPAYSFSNWPQRLWPMDRPYQYCGGFGAGGVGFNLGVAVGAALAHRPQGRVVLNLQNDGDLMYAPGALWTAAHHRIPMLTVMHNNRAYHQEVMHIQRMAARHDRGIDRAHIGTTISDPDINYAQIARGMGMKSEGPITAPHELGPALRRALAVVKRGEPALVDVITQPR